MIFSYDYTLTFSSFLLAFETALRLSSPRAMKRLDRGSTEGQRKALDYVLNLKEE